MSDTKTSDEQHKTPLVSIGLPVFNGANYIREALDSLLSQSFVNFELIISDNASTDETQKIIETYTRNDNRIRYFRQMKNIGPGPNYQFVLNQAVGKFFMWAAHDDTWDENWIQALINEIQPNDIGVRGTIRFRREDGFFLRYLKNYQKGAQLSCFLGNESNYRCHYTYSLFRREALLRCDFSSLALDYSPDNLFIFALLRHGSLRATSKTAMTFRVHDQNLGLSYSSDWKGIKKMVYRIHPLRYYIYHLRYIDSKLKKIALILLIPVKHIYAQISFWIRGAKELITGEKFI